MDESLSVIIPARNEMFLARTIENILENMRGSRTDIIAVCDGQWADPPINDHPKVTVIYRSESIGQRAAMNEAARLSTAKYIMKCDAHCSFDEGFDLKMMAEMHDDWTMVPIMKNLHAFDWVCLKCGDRRYQGPTPVSCLKCDNKSEFERDIKWFAKGNPLSTSYCFDPTPHFQYFQDFKNRPEYKADLDKYKITETMSLQGSCFMVTRDKYFGLNLCDEAFGSWGSQGIEVAVKTWLSGGRVVCNHNTWYGHMFRTQGGDFGFPYPISGRQTDRAKKYAKSIFFHSKWEKAIRPLSWLVEKFWPVVWDGKNNGQWKDEDLKELKSSEKIMVPEKEPIKNVTKDLPFTLREGIVLNKKEPTIGLVYYTDFNCEKRILDVTKKQLLKCSNGFDIVSVSLNYPVTFGKNIVLNLERSYLTMFKQQLAGIEASKADILFMVEHDVLYHPSHFKFRPPRKDMFYYDENRWMVDVNTGRALFYHAMSVSLMCGYRELLVEHYRKRVERVESEGRYSWRIGFEPGGHKFPRGIDNYGREPYWAEFPSIDMRHAKNLTSSRWSKDQFRNQSNLHAWTEADEVPGWGVVKGRFNEIIDAI